MNKKTIKIVSIILMAMVLIFSIANMALAAVNPADLTGTDPTDTSAVTGFGNQIIGILRIVGSIAAVIILMVLGFKYMMGSAEDKADYKKSMIPYLVGAICIFLAPMIAGAVYDFLQ
jgi:type IV secretory pathway VirB2 component (pilin)